MPNKASRRQFLTKSVQTVALTATGGLLWSNLLQQQTHAATHVVRPPGAHDQSAFNAKCIKCGQCVRDCPYDTLKLAVAGEMVAIGTPYFVPRETPCYMCEDIPCVKACPTGALDHSLENINDSRMGLAVIDIENCLSWIGLRCEICHRVCPIIDKAITIEHHPRKISKHARFVPLVHSNACTGCGVCEKACPTQVAAIRVVPAEMVQGVIGDHFRLGWKNDAPMRDEFISHERKDGSDVPATGLDYLNQDEF